MRIALVTYRRLPDLDPDDRPLAAVLAGRGHQVAAALWDDAARRLGVVRRRAAALDLGLLPPARRVPGLGRARGGGHPPLNPLDLVRWNSHKSYLVELRRRGARVIPTEIVRRRIRAGRAGADGRATGGRARS